jgi:hypothetical protein
VKLPLWFVTWLWDKVLCRDFPPYFHLSGYMCRWWLLGSRNVQHNEGRPGGAEPGGGRLYQWLTDRLCIRLHAIQRSDADRALHDHPSASVSIILKGGYWEVMEFVPKDSLQARNYADQLTLLPHLSPHAELWLRDYNIRWRGPGAVVFRSATAPHRIVLPKGPHYSWSIFALFKKSNKWGFYPGLESGETRKVPWREYVGQGKVQQSTKEIS